MSLKLSEWDMRASKGFRGHIEVSRDTPFSTPRASLQGPEGVERDLLRYFLLPHAAKGLGWPLWKHLKTIWGL